MSDPTTTPPTGQPTIDALLAFLSVLVQDATAALPVLEETAKATWSAITEGVSGVQHALATVRDIIDPANGREVERESELAAMFAAKDGAGLLAFYTDTPPHPNKSRAICASYLRLLKQAVPDDPAPSA